MSDIRIAETAAQTRGLLEFKAIDQEEREQAFRQAASAAMRDLEESKKDVPLTEAPERTRTEDAAQEREKREAEGEKPKRKEPKEPEELESLPEEREGHLINIRV